jgi:HK97 family phage prohead protease
MQFADIKKSFEIQDINDNEDIQKGFRGEISGYLSYGDVVDKDNEIITKNALSKALYNQIGDCIPFCFEHQLNKTLGLSQIKNATLEKNGGFRIIAQFGLHDLAQEKYELVKKGEYKALSIGARVNKSHKTIRYIKGKPTTIYDDIVINEGSLVKNPANNMAQIDIVKSADIMLFQNVESKKDWKDIMADYIVRGMQDSQLNFLWNIFNNIQDIDTIDDILKLAYINIDDDLLNDAINSARNISETKRNLNKAATQTAILSDTTSDATTKSLAEMLKKTVLFY